MVKNSKKMLSGTEHIEALHELEKWFLKIVIRVTHMTFVLVHFAFGGYSVSLSLTSMLTGYNGLIPH